MEEFVRVGRAVDADVWGLQEVLYSAEERDGRTPEGIRLQMNAISGFEWHMALEREGGNGRVIFSKYPVLWEGHLQRFQCALIDLPSDVADQDLLFCNLHLATSANVEGRLAQARAGTEFLKEVIDGEQSEIPADVQIVVAGDFNSRSDEYPYRAITSVNPDIPDGDYTQTIEDTFPVFLGSEDPKGGIDFMLARPGPLISLQSFALDTMRLSDEELTTYGLEEFDVSDDGSGGIDHLPYIADFGP